MAKEIVHGEESRQAILRGVNQLADAVKITLGSQGTQCRAGQEVRFSDRSPRTA